MKTTIETITPAVAEKYLDTMKGNRRVREPRVQYFADLIRNGRWRVTHQGLAFDEDGAMVDGQHRMWAVYFTNATVQVQVSRGLSREDVSAIDVGGVRDYADTAHFQGVDKDPNAAAIAKILVLGPGNRGRQLPFEVVNAWREHYREQIDHALYCRNLSRAGSKVMTIGMAAAFARAVFLIQPGILERMATVLGTGMTDDKKESAAIALRDAWISKRIGSLATEQYAKTEAAIRAFADRRPLRNLQRPEEELWEIPALPKALRYEPKAIRVSKTVTQRLKAHSAAEQASA